MDIKKIKKLIEILELSSISQIEIKEGKDSIKLCKNLPNVITSNFSQLQPNMISAPSIAHNLPSQIDNTSMAPPITVSNLENNSSIHVPIKSPMVGTFYSANSPESKPFVKVGDRIKKGDLLCIIEAMKMFNQIEAEVSGTIEEVLVQSGQPVEFGQPLFNILPE